MGCSLSQVRLIERGEARPTLQQVPKFCEAFGVGAEVFYPELVKVVPHVSHRLLAGPTQEVSLCVAGGWP